MNPMTTNNPSTGRTNVLPSHTAVNLQLRPIEALLESHQGATELAINTPGQAHIEIHGEWKEVPAPALTRQHLLDLCKAVAIFGKQDISERSPLLSATLPNGYRIQAVVPPALDADQIGVCIRVPGSTVRPLKSYTESGAFSRFVINQGGALNRARDHDLMLFELLKAGDLATFLVKAVLAKKNIAIVGDTGSGKTTLMKSLCQHIPLQERIITIEDVRELELPHPNKLHLLYTKGEGVAKVTPADLIGACMRLKPSRTLIAELRGAEAFDFLKLMTAGHSGAITSFHAPSCDVALERYVFMAKEHPNAAIFTDESLNRLIEKTFDIFLHFTAEHHYTDSGQLDQLERYVTEVRFDPYRDVIQNMQGDRQS
jgi:type IV secretion system protein VirB11